MLLYFLLFANVKGVQSTKIDTEHLRALKQPFHTTFFGLSILVSLFAWQSTRVGVDDLAMQRDLHSNQSLSCRIPLTSQIFAVKANKSFFSYCILHERITSLNVIVPVKVVIYS